MIDLLHSIIGLHASNEIVLFSDKLSSQIPRSRGAHAFNAFQRSMHLYALIRLMALWDSYGEDRISVPTVISYIEDPEVRARAINIAHDRELQQPLPYYEGDAKLFTQEMHDDWWRRDREYQANRAASEADIAFEFSMRKAKLIAASDFLSGLKYYRDTFIAHNLDQTLDQPTDPGPRPVRYGDEKRLLKATISIVHRLHIALNGTSFVWDSSRDIGRNNAEDLWMRCQFNFEPPAARDR